MPNRTLAFTTPAAAPAWKRWLVYSPLARIVIFVLPMLVLLFATGTLVHKLGWTADGPTTTSFGMADLLVRALPALIAHLLLVRLLERRRVDELAPGKWMPGGLAGIAVGLLMVSAVVGVLGMLGSYQVTGFNPHMNWLGTLTLTGLGAAIGEEIMFRGVLFRIVEEGLGTWWALAVSALFFGAIHLPNAGATVWSSAAIAIDAGLLFGLLYHVTRSLPACIGLHAAWNFAQGTVYGVTVSGNKADGWLVSTLRGPDWLTGGEFGLEASVVMVAVSGLFAFGLLMIALRRGSLVPCKPWQRRLRRGDRREADTGTFPTS